MEYTVRNYREKDRAALENICHVTATAPIYVKNKQLVCALYLDYYLDEEPSNCFVLTDEEDNAVGYVLCAEKYEAYHTVFCDRYLPEIKKMSRYEWLLHKLAAVVDKGVAKTYPAHLHVDILPSAQGQGGGRKLLGALIDHLKTIGVKGVCLTVGADNDGAIKFYQKLGFKRIKNIFNQAYVYGLKLQ